MKIVFYVTWNESTIHDNDGTMYDETAFCEPCVSGDFDTFADAFEWAQKEAVKDQVEVVTNTRYGNGTITRNIYEVCARAENPDSGMVEACSYDAEFDEYLGTEAVDVLDLHPEVLQAWKRANRSYCDWLDYEDDFYICFADALEKELGKDWEVLDYIKWTHV